MLIGDKNRRGDPSAESRTGSVAITRIPYHGWPDCYRISNDKVEAVVAPEVGRIMHFGLTGDEAGVFWANRLLEGKSPDPNSSDWLNFGGEKTWPAPQSEWQTMVGRPWPPPATFDSSPYAAKVVDDEIILATRSGFTCSCLLIRVDSLVSGNSRDALPRI
jgi:hypothetical protein